MALSLAGSSTFVTNANSPFAYGTFTFSTPGVWLVNYMIYSAAGATAQATLAVTSSASGILANIGASTTAFAQTNFTPPNGGNGTNLMFAAGTFITTNTGTAVTYDIYINVQAGTLNPYRVNSYCYFTRIG